MDIALTGDRPTGHLHLGHYVGSLRSRLELQHKYDQYIMVADMQALTDFYTNPSLVVENVYNVVEDYLCVGLDPEKNTIFIQSQIESLCELYMLFMNLVTVSRLERNPTVKTEIKQKKMGDSIPAGFLCYPVSQAADITAFSATIVPVGSDQIPMIEQTNEIVRKFNSIYGDGILQEAKPLLSDFVRLVGIDGKAKASKSLNNAIFLNDSNEVVEKKVMQMYTDANHLKVSDPGKVEGNVVFSYLDAFCMDKERVDQLKQEYSRGGLGDVTLKKMLISVLGDFFGPIRERRAKISREEIVDILTKSQKKAKIKANETLEKVHSAMGMKYF